MPMQTILYFLISLLGANLLFIVQPMAAKSALPILGGAPFVWNGCMVFFQTLLLGGYLYAHLLNHALPVKRQPLVHVPLLILALLAFPISFVGSTDIDAAAEPMLWLLSMLVLSVGLPFFVLSATSPLSQRWFAAATAREPYMLYAASNLGSFAGLLAYPILMEPWLSINDQANLLHYGFGLLFLLFAIAGFGLLRKLPTTARAQQTQEATTKITRHQIFSWIVLAFVPSSLLYGITSYITTDVAAVPLFWGVPLALYLLTFVLIFGRNKVALGPWRTLHLMGAPAMALLALLPFTYPMSTLLLHLAVFFATTMMCHSRLSALKPPPAQLTGFFLWVSFGGVLGGVFNTFIAPDLFNTVIEYPLMLIVSLGVVGWAGGLMRPGTAYIIRILLIWAAFGATFWLLGKYPNALAMVMDTKTVIVLLRLLLVLTSLMFVMIVYFEHRQHPLMHMSWIAPALLVLPILFTTVIDDHVHYTDRNIFGVSRIIYQPEKNAWVFRHGTTYHGFQSRAEEHKLEATSYYGEPVANVFAAIPPALKHEPVAVMGMGIGTVACYGSKGQQYDFYEIDPLVEQIAQDTRYFTYLRDCKPEKTIHMGDGRINLAKQSDKHYGAIIIDVFSSDAIPMHILTREAVAMYASKLREGGLMAFNVSNRHIDLIPVLSAIAEDNKLSGVWRLAKVGSSTPLQLSSKWVVLGKKPYDLARLKANHADWEPLPKPDASFLWRDDYSNILRSMR